MEVESMKFISCDHVLNSRDHSAFKRTDITKRKSMLIIHRDQSSKSEPSLVDMSVWFLSLNLSGLIFLQRLLL